MEKIKKKKKRKKKKGIAGWELVDVVIADDKYCKFYLAGPLRESSPRPAVNDQGLATAAVAEYAKRSRNTPSRAQRATPSWRRGGYEVGTVEEYRNTKKKGIGRRCHC